MIDFNLDAIQIVTFLVATVSPLLVGLVTTRVTAASTKAWLLAAIAAVTGFGSEFLATVTEGGVYDVGTGLVTAITAFLIAVGLHYGLYKPVGASEKLQKVGEHTSQ